MSFTHLHVHTEYSVDGISKIKDLFERAKKLGMPGLAITDHGTISGIPEFFSVAQNYPTITPIAGCEFYVYAFLRLTHLILLAKNLKGYQNLLKLSTLSRTKPLYRGRPVVMYSDINECREGLICLSACIGGDVAQRILNDDFYGAKNTADGLKIMFGSDFYLEVSLHKPLRTIKLAKGDDREAYNKRNQELVQLQQRANEGIFKIAKSLKIKVVATNDVHFTNPEDAIAQDLKLCRNQNKKVSDKERIRYSHLEYLKSEEEMRELFPDHPEVIENTMAVLKKIKRYSIENKPMLPHISDTPNEDLRKLAYEGAEKRYGTLSEQVKERLEKELNYIEGTGFSSYFLIIKDIVDWVRSNGWGVNAYPYRGGAGSCLGSLVNYCLGVTDVDPLKYNLLFEGFITPYKALPFNIALGLEGQAHRGVKKYLQEKYGYNSVICPLFVPKVVYPREDGLIIGPAEISDCLPLESKPGSEEKELYSRYDKASAEYVGAVFFRLWKSYSLERMRIITQKIKENYDVDIEIDAIPLDDDGVYALFRKGNTNGIDQFDLQSLQEVVNLVRPKRIQDLMDSFALWYTSKAQRQLFVSNKKNQRKLHNGLPEIKEVLSETYGVLVYKEQIIQIAQKVAGFDIDDSARLLKAVVNKEKAFLLLYQAIFLSEGLRKGYHKVYLKKLWMRLVSEGEKTCSKAFAIASSLTGYKMAWLKVHYPEEFYFATINAAIIEEERENLIKECECQGFTVVQPDKSPSGFFEVVKKKC